MLKQMIRGALALALFFCGGFSAQLLLGSKMHAPAPAHAVTQDSQQLQSQIDELESFARFYVNDLGEALVALGADDNVMGRYFLGLDLLLTDIEHVRAETFALQDVIVQEAAMISALQQYAQALQAQWAACIANDQLEHQLYVQAETDLAAANADLTEITRLMGMAFGKRKLQPNNGQSPLGRAAIALILTTP